MKIVTLSIALLFIVGSVHAADLILVDKDTPSAPIIVFKDAPPRTREAAVTLADYIDKISGARPEVIDGEPHPLPERAIWVGVQPAVKTLFPTIDFNYGTINAVYTFLQDRLGVRWFWPGELGEDVIKRDRIAIAPLGHQHVPRIRSRGGSFHLSSLGEQDDRKARRRSPIFHQLEPGSPHHATHGRPALRLSESEGQEEKGERPGFELIARNQIDMGMTIPSGQ